MAPQCRRKTLRCIQSQGTRPVLEVPDITLRYGYRCMVDRLFRTRPLRKAGRQRLYHLRRFVAECEERFPADAQHGYIRTSEGDERKQQAFGADDPLRCIRTTTLRHIQLERRRGIQLGCDEEPDTFRTELCDLRYALFAYGHRRFLRLGLLQRPYEARHAGTTGTLDAVGCFHASDAKPLFFAYGR